MPCTTAVSSAINFQLPQMPSGCKASASSSGSPSPSSPTTGTTTCTTTSTSAPEPANCSRRSTANYNQSVVGAATQATNDLQIDSVLDIYWEESERSFAGTISAYDGETGEHHIKYHDGTDDWEELGEMTWVLISAPSFRDVSEVNSTRNQRLAWDGV